jgi:hypothetical protein
MQRLYWHRSLHCYRLIDSAGEPHRQLPRFQETYQYSSARPRVRNTHGQIQSPWPHWRRGHWHTVLHGEKRQSRRMQWFQPVYVGLS